MRKMKAIESSDYNKELREESKTSGFLARVRRTKIRFNFLVP